MKLQIAETKIEKAVTIKLTILTNFSDAKLKSEISHDMTKPTK